MLVSDVMTEDPSFVNSDQTFGEAVIVLLEKHVRHLPVLEDGVVVGIVSDRDLRGSSGASDLADLFDDPTRLLRLMTQRVSDIMSPDVIAVTPERDLRYAVDLLIEHQVGALPVVDPGSNKLVGIVSYIDALRALRDLAWG
jgi:acetoin utilization protein AcuB